MPLDPSRLCPCHGDPMFRASNGRHVCRHKWQARAARYSRKAKVKVLGRKFYSVQHAAAIRLLRDRRRKEFRQRQAADAALED